MAPPKKPTDDESSSQKGSGPSGLDNFDEDDYSLLEESKTLEETGDNTVKEAGKRKKGNEDIAKRVKSMETLLKKTHSDLQETMKATKEHSVAIASHASAIKDAKMQLAQHDKKLVDNAEERASLKRNIAIAQQDATKNVLMVANFALKGTTKEAQMTELKEMLLKLDASVMLEGIFVLRPSKAKPNNPPTVKCFMRNAEDVAKIMRVKKQLSRMPPYAAVSIFTPTPEILRPDMGDINRFLGKQPKKQGARRPVVRTKAGELKIRVERDGNVIWMDPEEYKRQLPGDME